MSREEVRFVALGLKSIVVHSVTYFVAGLLAYTLGDYEKTFSEPPLSYFMRPTSDPWVMVGPLIQPIRGLIFALAFYPFRGVLFGSVKGCFFLWWLLVALGILSTFGPAPGSVEGLVYTTIPPISQILGLWETVLQTVLFAGILWYWVRNPDRTGLAWVLGTAFILMNAMLVAGLLLQAP